MTARANNQKNKLKYLRVLILRIRTRLATEKIATNAKKANTIAEIKNGMLILV
jgi:hypothetical protein